jgi:hypothetical protein
MRHKSRKEEEKRDGKNEKGLGTKETYTSLEEAPAC